MHQVVDIQRRRYGFFYCITFRVELCHPEGVVIRIPEVGIGDSKSMYDLRKFLAKDSGLLGVILHAVDPADKPPVLLLQAVEYHVVRDGLIMDVNIGQQDMTAYGGPAVDIGDFQITVFPDLRFAGKDAVVSCRIPVDAAVHLIRPGQGFILLGAAAHQRENLTGGAEMNELGRRQAQELQPERTQGFPDYRTGIIQFRTKRAFRLLFIVVLQSRIFRQGVKEVPVEGETYRVVHILFI